MNKILSENQINNLLAKQLRKENCIVLNRLRFTAAEFDVIIFDPDTLSLINIEIKKDKWEKLFHQAIRGKLYCHYSLVMVPVESKNDIDLTSFAKEGIGVIFFEIKRNKLLTYLELQPSQSNIMNRNLKKRLYKQVISKYRDQVYA